MLFSRVNSDINRLVFRLIITSILSITSHEVFSQVFSANQNPPSINWKQIHTENFQLIYPDSFEEQAQRMANTLESITKKVSASLGKQPRKISIILQNQGTTSNGFVQLAPRRSEFFATPSQAFDYQNWLNSLAVHELRHVVQFDKLTGKFNQPPLEALALAMFGITLPSWFFEGDAVTTETVLTPAGRGRIPEWNIIMRTNTLSGKKYSYSKDYFGSVKDFTPGYYQLGFFMNTKLRRDFGNRINDSLLRRISRNPFRPYNFSNSVKKFTGLSTRKLHDSTVNELDNLWSQQLKKISSETYASLNVRKGSTPENFLLPVRSVNGTILYLKESKAHTPAIYELSTDGKSKRLLNLGSQEIPWFSYAARKIVWDEFRFDARYQQRSFNVVNIFDLKTRSKKQLTHRSRLFAPSLSPDGELIVAVEVSTSHKISIVELSAATGKELKRYPAPQSYMLQMPAFNSAGDKIVVVAVATSGKSIYELNRTTGEFRQLMPFQLQEILRPVYAANRIIFKAHFNGIDNVYSLDPATKEIHQLTSAKYGANHPSYEDKTQRVLFSNYGQRGYDISSLDLRNSRGRNIHSIDKFVVNYADPLIPQEADSNIFDSIPQKVFPSRRYRETANLFYFHSLVPVYEENDFTDDYNYGLYLQSNNKLNTLSMYAGYRFNNALRKSEYEGSFSYSRYFPIFSFSYLNQARLLNRRLISASGTSFIPVTWRENEYKADITIPILANRFNNTYRMNIKAGTSYTTRYAVQNNFAGLIQTLDFPMHYELSVSRSSRRSARDLAPRWGQNLFVRYRHFPFENQIDGELLTFQSNFYFPGILRNHSLQASFNFQNAKGSYSSTVDIPRVSGYSFMTHTTNPRNTLLLDYRFPLLYPDWELGPLAYIKRFKGGLFVDFENAFRTSRRSPHSFGAELRADMNLLRFPLPNFDLGGRIIFLKEKSNRSPIFETVAVYNF